MYIKPCCTTDTNFKNMYKPRFIYVIRYTHQKSLYPYNFGISSENMKNRTKNYFFFIPKFPGERFNKVPGKDRGF